jgi:hypothetical protein
MGRIPLSLRFALRMGGAEPNAPGAPPAFSCESKAIKMTAIGSLIGLGIGALILPLLSAKSVA